MENFEDLLEHMNDELEDAENYAWEALEEKHSHSEQARVKAELSRQELVHYEMLQTLAMKEANELEKHEHHNGIAAFWKFEDGRMTKRKMKIEHLLKSFHK